MKEWLREFESGMEGEEKRKEMERKREGEKDIERVSARLIRGGGGGGKEKDSESESKSG